MIDVHYASLTSRRVQHRVFYLDGHPSRYQPCPTGLNCGEQTGTGVFPLVIAVKGKTLLWEWAFIVSKQYSFKTITIIITIVSITKSLSMIGS